MRTNYLPGHVAGLTREISLVAITLIFAAVAFLSSEQSARAQGFSSGSTGADGALDFSQTAPGTVVEFNPAAFNPPLDPDGDNIYHFTTINIPAGVTVKLSAKYLNGPVVWLATGDVQISGTLDLTGRTGHGITDVPANRIPSVSGPGGFGGGIGGHTNATRPAPAQPGNGPAGGVPRTSGDLNGNGGGFSGNRYLVPLLGGSGGAGGNADGPNTWGSGGGAGGGAILIVSTTNISVNGNILADGGDAPSQNSCCHRGGGGAGGAIRLVAGTIGGSGRLSAHLGAGARTGGFGFIRLEAFRHEFNGTFNNGRGDTPVARSSPSALFLPASTPSVRAVSVAGVPVPPNPTGSFEIPDVTINDGAAITIAVEARYVPVGTVVRLHLFSENEGDQIVDSPPLQGTLEHSTATVSVVVPPGFSRGFVRAVWR
jgi:hypothetical protein